MVPAFSQCRVSLQKTMVLPGCQDTWEMGELCLPESITDTVDRGEKKNILKSLEFFEDKVSEWTL